MVEEEKTVKKSAIFSLDTSTIKQLEWCIEEIKTDAGILSKSELIRRMIWHARFRPAFRKELAGDIPKVQK